MIHTSFEDHVVESQILGTCVVLLRKHGFGFAGLLRKFVSMGLKVLKLLKSKHSKTSKLTCFSDVSLETSEIIFRPNFCLFHAFIDSYTDDIFKKIKIKKYITLKRKMITMKK